MGKTPTAAQISRAAATLARDSSTKAEKSAAARILGKAD